MPKSRSKPLYEKLIRKLPKAPPPPEEEDPQKFRWHPVSGQEIRAWMRFCGYTTDEAAEKLQIGRRLLFHLLKNQKPIPERVARQLEEYRGLMGRRPVWAPKTHPRRMIFFDVKVCPTFEHYRDSVNYGLNLHDLAFYRFITKKQRKKMRMLFEVRRGKRVALPPGWGRYPIDKAVGCVVLHRPSGLYAKVDNHFHFGTNRRRAMKALAKMLGYRDEIEERWELRDIPKEVDVDAFMGEQIELTREEKGADPRWQVPKPDDGGT